LVVKKNADTPGGTKRARIGLVISCSIFCLLNCNEEDLNTTTEKVLMSDSTEMDFAGGGRRGASTFSAIGGEGRDEVSAPATHGKKNGAGVFQRRAPMPTI
jgi:hypothetical protein